MNYKLNISYCGTNFYGWAKQPNLRTVQGEIQNIIKNIFSLDNVIINASGRTDKYVHAIKQIINIKHKDLKISSEQLLNALNSQLPNDIRINSIILVDDNFHARYDCKNKSYLYVLNTNQIKDIFNQNNIYQLNTNINIQKLKYISKFFIGKHNFLSFSTSELANTVRTINFINIKQENNLIFIEINGDGFLRNMVRMICAFMIDFCLDKVNINNLNDLFNFPQKGKSQNKLPGCGLYLYNVNY